jgi:hypothetical protein
VLGCAISNWRNEKFPGAALSLLAPHTRTEGPRGVPLCAGGIHEKSTSQKRNPSAVLVLVLLCSDRAVIRTKINPGGGRNHQNGLGGGIHVDNYKCARALNKFKSISELGQSPSTKEAFWTRTRTQNSQQRGAAIKPAALGFYITFWPLHARGAAFACSPFSSSLFPSFFDPP